MEETIEKPQAEQADELMAEVPATPEENAEEVKEITEEEVQEVTEDTKLTDDDVNEVFEKHNKGFQKRIDKLTYEKNVAREQLAEREKEIERLKQNFKEMPGEYEKPKYTKEQLATAKAKAIQDNDLELYDEIMQQQIRWAQYEAEQKILAPQRQFEAVQQQANQDWNDFVESYDDDGDKDLDVKNPNSTVRQYMTRLIQENPNYYNFNVLGSRVYREAAERAANIVIKAKYNKATNKKTKQLQNDLVKEKIKTQLSAGHPTGSGEVNPPKKKSNPLDDFVSMRESQHSKTQGMIRAK